MFHDKTNQRLGWAAGLVEVAKLISLPRAPKPHELTTQITLRSRIVGNKERTPTWSGSCKIYNPITHPRVVFDLIKWEVMLNKWTKPPIKQWCRIMIPKIPPIKTMIHPPNKTLMTRSSFLIIREGVGEKLNGIQWFVKPMVLHFLLSELYKVDQFRSTVDD